MACKYQPKPISIVFLSPMFLLILVFLFLLSTTDLAKASNELEHYMVTVQEPNIGPLHEVNPPVHQWVANEAYDYFVSQIEGADITTYLGTISGSFTPNDDDFIEGTYAEDQENRDPLYQLLPWMRHYCAGADGSEIYVGLLTYRSNYDQALDIWNNYAIPDYPSNKARAFYRLGHVAHLLIDMTVPAHTHNDQHAVWDTYEETMAYNDQYTWWYYGCTRAGDWNHPLTLFADLYSLFYRTANYTEDYDSDDKDGDGPPYYNPDDYPETWHRPGEVDRSDGLDASEITIIADDLMPYAIRRVADLYRLFYSEVDTSDPISTMTYPTSEDVYNPNYRTSTSAFDLTAIGSDAQSGIVKKGYEFQWCYDSGSGWSDWVDVSPSPTYPYVSFTPPYNNTYYAFHVWAENGGGNWGDSTIKYLYIDATNPSSPSITGYSDSGHSSTLVSGNQYPYPNPHFHFSASDSGSGIKGYYYYWGTNPNADPSVWNTSGEYTASGLTVGNDYYFRVKAQDKAGNIGSISTFTYRYRVTDTTPPTPNPMTWATEPYPTSSTSIRMVATTASDPSGVEYYFDETSGNSGGSDSGWQDSTTYEDTGLQPGTTYIYRVKARDKSSNRNETNWSVAKPATTYSPPAAEFTCNPDGGYPPLTVYFTDQSTGEITSWSWNFGDGATSTESNPSHNYDLAGYFTVSLTVAGPGGSDTETKTNYIQVVQKLDLNDDGRVNFPDFAILAKHWLETCSEPGWCEGADIDWSGEVNGSDLQILTESWLREETEIPGLIGFWKFDEESGINVTDSSGHGNDGTIQNGATRLPGLSGSAISLDGTDDYVKIPYNSCFGLTDEVSILAWVKRGNLSENSPIVSKATVSRNGTANFELWISSDGSVRFYFYIDGWRFGNSMCTIMDAEWHHIVATYNRSEICLYIDGNLDRSVPETAAMLDSGEDVILGLKPTSWPFDYLNGFLDEVRIYDRALTATEIQSLYNKR